MEHHTYINLALELALKNVTDGSGGPFGALVVKDEIIIGTGVNQVTILNDPTAHAEIMAIRAACTALNSFQLADCILYSSCEPCPMCFGAIYWARPSAIYYAATRHEAAAIGFDDAFIYEQLHMPHKQQTIPMLKLEAGGTLKPFDAWRAKGEKIRY